MPHRTMAGPGFVRRVRAQLCQKGVSAGERQWRRMLLTFLTLLQLVLYIPLLALVGQGILFVLAGHRRQSNFFYQLLELLSKPFTYIVRKITPRQVGDHQVPIVTFFLVVLAYIVVTLERIQLCVQLGVEVCR